VGGCIELVAARRGDELELRVLDDGPGFPPTASTAAGGVGLANVRDRVAQMYGLAACLETANRPERGAVVTIRLPFRAGAEPVSAAPAAPAVAGR
jgi:signal transduction histidine kinase